MLSERKKTNNPQTLDIKSDNVGRAFRWELNSRTFECKRLLKWIIFYQVNSQALVVSVVKFTNCIKIK